MDKKNVLIGILSLCLVATSAVAVVALNGQDEQTEMERIYAQYVVHAQAEGEEPLSYVAWLASIKGEKGEQGDKGEKGDDGKSAYQVWLDAGYEGTEDAFLAWLKGETGKQGVGIQKVEYDEKGDLKIIYTDNTWEIIEMPDKHTHDYGEWINFLPNSTSCEDRLYYRVCSGCKDFEWKQGSADDHVWMDSYSSDASYHWYNCERCDDKKDKQEHTQNEESECTVCGQTVGFTEGVAYAISADGDYAEVVGYTGTVKSVRIADTYQGLPVKNITKDAFYKNKQITSVYIPDSVTTIADYAFWNCTGLKKISFSNSLTAIGKQVFYWCTKLDSVNIPTSVLSIGDDAFSGCESLANVSIPAATVLISNDCFWACESLNRIEVDEANPAYKDIDGHLYNKDGSILIQYAVARKDTEFIVPNTVKTIGVYAFGYCLNLMRIVIGDSVTIIDDAAFLGCSNLTSVKLGNSVATIGDSAFDCCASLTDLVMSESVTSVGYWAFYGCASLTFTTYGNCKYLASKNNPCYVLIDAIDTTREIYATYETTKVIADSAFYECSNMTSVVIANSVTTIGERAFSGYAKLTTVYYQGAKNAWENVTVNVNNSELANATTYYYSDEIPSEEGNYWRWVNGYPVAW